MSYTVRLAPEVQQQLIAIETYIVSASGQPAVAAQFVDGIIAYCVELETFPARGRRRDDLLPGLRIVGYRKTVNRVPGRAYLGIRSVKQRFSI